MRKNKTIIKKATSLLLTAAITLSSVCIPVSKVSGAILNYGDVNKDTSIDILDIIMLKSYIVENNISGLDTKTADLDGDGKVSYKDVAELILFLLNVTKCFSNELGFDTDNDGISDYIEKNILMTDYTKSDTDRDGLSDYDEIYKCNTDPLCPDTNSTGKNDSLKDTDNDKLNNKQEISYKTDPLKYDTDDDGLSDYDEINVYKTDPVNPDSDGDGLCDKAEILFKSDPLNPKTDDITDTDKVFPQNIESDNKQLKAINESNTDYTLSISTQSSGYIEQAITISRSKYSEFLKQDAILGDIVDIDYDDSLTLSSLKVSFELKNVSDVKKYAVFKYVKDANILLPAVTDYDGNTISVTDEKDGTYCVVDLDEISNTFISDDNVNTGDAEYMSSIDNVSASNTKKINFNCNIYIRTYNVEPWANISSTIKETASKLEKNGYSPQVTFSFIVDAKYFGGGSRYYVVSVNCANTDMIDEVITFADKYFSLKKGSPDDAYNKYMSMAAQNTGTVKWPSPSGTNSNYYTSNEITFAFEPQTALSQRNCCFDISSSSKCYVVGKNIIQFKSMYYNLLKLKNGNNTSDIMYDILTYGVGKSVYRSSFFSGLLLKTHLTSEIVKAYKKGMLSAEAKKSLGCMDTDGDGILDTDEIDISKISVINDKLVFPTFNDAAKSEPVTLKGLSWIDTVIKMSTSTVPFGEMTYVPEWSKPYMADSDGDNIDDKDDAVPFAIFNPTFEKTDDYDQDIMSRCPAAIKERKESHEYISLSNGKKYYGLDFVFNNAQIIYPNKYQEKYALNMATAQLLNLAANIGDTELARCFLSMAFGDLFNDRDVYGKIPNATDVLKHYLDRTGDTFYFKTFDDAVLLSRSQRNAYYRHMNMLFDTVEDTLKPGSSSCFQTSTTASDMGISFENDPYATLRVSNDNEIDWWIAIGGATNGIISSVTCYEDKGSVYYKAKLKYLLFDVYDWDEDSGEKQLYDLHVYGWARSFYDVGCFENEIVWKKGARYTVEKNIYKTDLSANNFFNIQDKKISDYVVPLKDLVDKVF